MSASKTQSVTLGRIVYVNEATGQIGIETRIGQRLLVAASKCETSELNVAVHMLGDDAYAVQGISEWADVSNYTNQEYTA